ncbi:hypothetical protein GOP47_0025168 [Adiantum capillus-veneris]|uniref:Uncharacterized protein n=1 Tax=Adiantum capillus-veneris TaxID=13818 RepID=A0A9D4U3E8_ADICA|nr:hypothetical protein GOP47_0025168 [Adiantum capillus-veneris]
MLSISAINTVHTPRDDILEGMDVVPSNALIAWHAQKGLLKNVKECKQHQLRMSITNFLCFCHGTIFCMHADQSIAKHDKFLQGPLSNDLIVNHPCERLA